MTFVRHAHCNLDSFFLLKCLNLYLVKLFWNAQLLDTGAPIARDWVVTALGFSATLVSNNHAFVRHPHCNLDSFFLLELPQKLFVHVCFLHAPLSFRYFQVDLDRQGDDDCVDIQARALWFSNGRKGCLRELTSLSPPHRSSSAMNRALSTRRLRQDPKDR